MTIWEIQGVSEEATLREIKKAYAARARKIHPEEHPEEFEQFQRAYELAKKMKQRQGRKISAGQTANSEIIPGLSDEKENENFRRFHYRSSEKVQPPNREPRGFCALK